jgi:hypothetical protein
MGRAGAKPILNEGMVYVYVDLVERHDALRLGMDGFMGMVLMGFAPALPIYALNKRIRCTKN